MIPRRVRWPGRLAAFTISLLLRMLAATWRTRIHDQSGCFDGTNNGPILVAIWHNRLALAMTFWKWGSARRPGAGLAALISASRDGGLLTRTVEHFGVRAVRGSSSRRGPQALLELVSATEQGYHVAITPDGPRGPKYVVRDGIIALAQATGLPIVPVGARVRGKIRLRSWDQFQIPLPFSRCDLYWGAPIFVARDATPEEREQARARLENTLRNLNPD